MTPKVSLSLVTLHTTDVEDAVVGKNEERIKAGKNLQTAEGLPRYRNWG